MKPKDTTKKKIKKKNRKLLFQIGLVTMIYSLLAVLVTSGILYCAVVIVYVQTKQDQLSDGLERVYENIFESEYPVELTERMLDAIDADPGILTELFPKLYVGIDDEKSDQLMERYYDYIETWEQEYGEIDRRFYKDMPEEYLPCAVVNEYFTLFYELVSEQNEYQYKNILFLRISQDAQGEYCGRVLFQMDQEDCGESRDYFFHYFDQQHMEFLSHLIEKNRFGESWDDIADHKELADMLKTNSHEVAYEVDYLNEANESMTVYYPIFIEDKPRCVLAITYDWAEAQDILKDNTSGLTRIALLLVMTSEVLLLLFVYFKAVRPLRHVMKSMQKYTEDKNSEEVVQEMDEVRQRNEFGLLADYISDMVQEIDRYTKKNIELAGEKEKAATELELAAKIQNGMLRVDFPNTPEVEIFAMMNPAREVGGDFYDFFEVDATHMALVIADVAGKGVPGSLFMMSALTMIRGKTLAGVSPAQILAEVNEELLKGGDFGDMFVTVWLGILDLESGILTATNAGHEYPIVKKGERFELLKDQHGFVVGGMEGVKYQNYEIDLSAGGTIFVYTDGVPEATATSDELYGTDRILDTLNLHPDATPAELANGVKLDVDIFVGDAEQFDDLTIMCVRYHRSALRKDG
ncbi:MAG: PP2C family protein-serine/threonine phosphatase [Lachnospiraceae bacterium]|nr:PP2C family protein-serine/threonine phosphatase [Lachnospiraceae bacterium]